MTAVAQFDCPRCHQPTEAEFYGPCGACRGQLRSMGNPSMVASVGLPSSAELAERVRGWSDTVDRPCPRCGQPRPVLKRVIELHPTAGIPWCSGCSKRKDDDDTAGLLP